MDIKAVGIDLDDNRVRGDLKLLAGELEYFHSCGFDLVELGTPGLCFLFAGRVDRERAAEIRRLLRRFPLRYTLHLPDSLNLGLSLHPERELSVFQACLEFAAEAGAEAVVYHSGQYYLELTSPQLRQEAYRRERDALAALAGRAGAADILVAVENCNPEPGEAALVAERGLNPEELRQAHPALYLDRVAAQVEEIAAANLGIALDAGHLFLACQLTGEPFLEAVSRNARLVRHLHLNDNFGRNPSGRYSRLEQVLYGEADCHLPPGMGSVPLAQVLERLSGYSGFVVFEIRSEYRNLLPRCLRWLQERSGEQPLWKS